MEDVLDWLARENTPVNIVGVHAIPGAVLTRTDGSYRYEATVKVEGSSQVASGRFVAKDVSEVTFHSKNVKIILRRRFYP